MNNLLMKTFIFGVLLFGSQLVMADELPAEEPTEEVPDGYDDSHRDEHITAKIGGQLQTMSFYGKGGTEKKTTQQQDIYFLTTGNVDVNATGITRDGLQYGATISLSSDYASVEQMQSNVFSAYLDFGGDWGTVKCGTLSSSAAGELAVDGASATLGGQEGFAGYLGSVYTGCVGAITSQYMAYEVQGGSTISYSTPDISGFTVGISYTPHSKMVGSSTKADSKNGVNVGAPTTSNSYPAVKNMIAGGVQHNYYQDDWHTTTSLVLWHGRPSKWSDNYDLTYSTTYENLNAYQLGFVLGYKDFTVGIGYMDMTNSLLNKTLSDTAGLRPNAHAGKAYTIGVSYVLGKYKLATAYMFTVAEFGSSSKAKCNAWSTTLDYNYVDGLVFYGEVNFIETRTCTQALLFNGYTADDLSSQKYKSSGAFFVVGTRVSF